MPEFRCGNCRTRVCWLMSSKPETPSFCPYCGERGGFEFHGDGSEDDNEPAFRDIADARDFACYYDEIDDEVPVQISDMVARILPYHTTLANTLWHSLYEIVGDAGFFDPYAYNEANFEWKNKTKNVSKKELAMLIARYAFAGGLIYREYLKHGGKRLKSMRGDL